MSSIADFSFEYLPPLSVSSIFPSTIPFGLPSVLKVSLDKDVAAFDNFACAISERNSTDLHFGNVTVASIRELSCSVPDLTFVFLNDVITLWVFSNREIIGRPSVQIVSGSPPQILSVFPSILSTLGQSVVTIFGVNFNAGTTALGFRNEVFVLNQVPTLLVISVSPNDDSTSIFISVKNGLLISNGVLAYFRTPPSVVSVFPSVISSSAGVFVTVLGIDIISQTKCRCGTEWSSDTYVVDNRTIICGFSALTSMYASLILSSNHQHHGDGARIYIYDYQAIRVFPSYLNSVIDSNSLNIYGSGLVNGTEAMLNNRVVPLTLINASSSMLLVPWSSLSNMTSVGVCLSFGNQCVSKTVFVTVSRRELISITPSFFSEMTGSLLTLTVFGHILSNSMVCFESFESTKCIDSPPVQFSLNYLDVPVITPFLARGTVSVFFRFPDKFETNRVSAVVLSSTKLISIKPTIAPIIGGSRITVFGENFPVFCKCSFGEILQEFDLSSRTSGTCLLPTQSRPLNVSFSLTCARESLTLVYHDSMLMSLVPTRGSVFGGTVVTLTISSSIWSPSVHIQFGSIISQCSWNNSQHICHSPSVGQAVVNTIFLSLDGGLSFFQTSFSWEHFYAPVVRQITPSNYACASGASITVVGKHLASCPWKLKIANFMVDCIFTQISDDVSVLNLISLCSGIELGLQTVDVLCNNSSVSVSYFDILLYQSPSIQSVSPSILIDGVSQAVTVHGSYFDLSESNSCIVRSQLFPAILLAPDTLWCLLPPMRPGSLFFSVSGSHDFFKLEVLKSNLTTSSMLPTPSFLTIYPSEAFSSIPSIINVLDVELPSQNIASCLFGTQIIPAVSCVEHDHCLSCVTPTFDDSHFKGIVRFGIASSGISSETVPFRFIPAPEVYFIEPSKVSGFDGYVTVVGAGFEWSVEYICVWPRQRSPALYVSQTSVLCKVQPFLFGKVFLSLFPMSHQFEFECMNSTALQIDPVFGSIYGGTSFSLIGLQKSSVVVLRFGNAGMYGFCHQEPASQFNSWICTSPSAFMFKVGVVEVLMSLDSSAFTGTGVFWTFVEDPVIIKIQPSIVSPTGPQVMSIWGRHLKFSDHHPACKFGSNLIAASVINDSYVQCTKPRELQLGKSLIEYTVNGRDVMASHSFYVSSLPIINSLIPSVGNANGGYVVSIVGSGFETSLNYLVDIPGVNSSVSTTRISEVLLIFIMPSQDTTFRNITIFVKAEHEGERSVPAKFLISEFPLVMSIFPSHGCSSSASIVKVQFQTSSQLLKGISSLSVGMSLHYSDALLFSLCIWELQSSSILSCLFGSLPEIPGVILISLHLAWYNFSQ